jgi:hypothetical protein
MHQFLHENTRLDWQTRRFSALGDYLYVVDDQLPDLDGVKVVRPGMYVGMNKKNRFEPGHSLALTLRPDEVRCSLRLNIDDERLARYLRGETLTIREDELTFAWDDEGFADVGSKRRTKFYVLVCVEHHSIGWGKWQDGMLKNEYPQTWRRMS